MASYLATRWRKWTAQAPYLPRTLTLVWRAAGRWTLAWLALLIVQGLLPAAVVQVTRVLVDAVAGAIGGGVSWATARPVVAWGAVMGALLLIGEILEGVAAWVRTAQAERVGDYLAGRIQDQSARLDLAFYDSPGYFDHLHRARAEARHRPVALVEGLGATLRHTLTLGAMAAILARYGAWIPIALLVSTLPAIVVVLLHARREHAWRREATPRERRAWYYDWTLTARETAAEVRLFGLAAGFRELHDDLRSGLRRERLALLRSRAIARLFAGLVGLAVTAGALVWMAGRALAGAATLGDVALFYQAFRQGQGFMRSLLENLGQIYSNSLFLSDLYEFLALEPSVVSPPRPRAVSPAVSPTGGETAPSLRFRAVVFRYPGVNRAALDGFDLDIPAGAHVALVGANGAGKSTVLKLACRFYDPDEGRVELDGADLRSFALAAVRARISVLFQRPVAYQETLARNIELGDLAQATPDAVRAAAEAAGLSEIVARLPGGYDALLGRWFDGGTDLSVGEWQRVALARAFLRRAPLMILDEPTSTMDPWSEAEWSGRFVELARGRTVLMITHRLVTAMAADRIHVLDQGRIIESGTHLQLLDRGGRYAASWREQMRRAQGARGGDQ